MSASASAWRALRWVIALALGALLVVLAVPAAIDALRSSVQINEQDGDGAPADDPQAPEQSDPTGPVRDGAAAAETDLAVRGGTVGQRDAPRLELAGAAADSGIVAGFGLIDGDPACVSSLELAVDVVEASPGELDVYASAVSDVGGLADGETVEPLTLGDEPRSVAVSDGTPGRLSWDLTELYSRWTGDLTPPGTDLAVVIRPRREGQRVLVASVESDDSAGPRLAWTGAEGCG